MRQDLVLRSVQDLAHFLIAQDHDPIRVRRNDGVRGYIDCALDLLGFQDLFPVHVLQKVDLLHRVQRSLLAIADWEDRDILLFGVK